MTAAAAVASTAAGEPAKKRQAIRESDREEELRHDRVGVAAIRVVVLEDRRHDLVAAHEIDEEHADHGIAAKLVQRDDSAASPVRSMSVAGDGRFASGSRRVVNSRPLAAGVPTTQMPRASARPTGDNRASWPASRGRGRPRESPRRPRAARAIRRRSGSRTAPPDGRRPPATRDGGRGRRPATCDRRSASRRFGGGARSTGVIAGFARMTVARMSGSGRIPDPTGRACQQSPRGVNARTASLT